MKKNNYLSIARFSGLLTVVCASVLFGNNVGVGVRALSFANNHTAVANDLSAAYWNPAALAFLPVREFQVSIDGNRTYLTSDVSGRDITGIRLNDYKDRIRLGSIGVMSAIPTVQGGLTLAALYENPHTFDGLESYQFRFDKDNSRVKGEATANGGLNNWSGSFGVQVANGLAAGATVSLITGTEHSTLLETLDDEPYNDVEYEYNYMGVGLRAGILYAPSELLRLGMQITLPQNLRFKVKETDNGNKFHDNGNLYRALSGAWGLGVKLPWMTIALDGRFTMPYTFILPSEKIPSSSQAKYFKLGSGIGFEVPLMAAPVVLRGGYSYDEYDLFSSILKFDDEKIDWDPYGYSVDQNRHTITAGVGVFTSGTGLELSYGYETWALRLKPDDYIKNYTEKQKFASHRIAVAFIVRY